MNNNHTNHARYWQPLLLTTVAALLILSLWLRTHNALWVMEIIGLLLALVVLLQRKTLPLHRFTIGFIVYTCTVLSLYLIPIPIDAWLQLPGRQFYQPVVQLLADHGQAITSHTLSVDPYSTVQMLLSILPALGIFLATSTLDTGKLYWLARVFVAVAAYQAAWGMIQYSSSGIPAKGSYQNQDHYVTLMAFALPLTIALISHQLQQTHHHHHNDVGNKQHTLILAFYGLAAFLMFLGGLFSMSRAGIPTIFLGAVLTPLLISGRTRKTHIFLFIILFLLVGLTLAQMTGIIPVINKFIGSDPLQDARWIMFERQLEAIRLFFPLGTGPGTFTEVYTAFQPMEQVGDTFISHAHNDYLELLMDTGAFGISILLFFLWVFAYGWWRLWRRRDRSLAMLQTSAGVGMLCALFHAFFDFNFHTIPHPLLFAFAGGIFLKTASTA